MLGRENPENKILSMDTGKQTILGAQAKIHDCDQTSTTLITDWLGCWKQRDRNTSSQMQSKEISLSN